MMRWNQIEVDEAQSGDVLRIIQAIIAMESINAAMN